MPEHHSDPGRMPQGEDRTYDRRTTNPDMHLPDRARCCRNVPLTRHSRCRSAPRPRQADRCRPLPLRPRPQGPKAKRTGNRRLRRTREQPRTQPETPTSGPSLIAQTSVAASGPERPNKHAGQRPLGGFAAGAFPRTFPRVPRGCSTESWLASIPMLVSCQRDPLEAQEPFEADGQAGAVGDGSDRQERSRRERGPVIGVRPDREGLAPRAQDDLLVGHQADPTRAERAKLGAMMQLLRSKSPATCARSSSEDPVVPTQYTTRPRPPLRG